MSGESVLAGVDDCPPWAPVLGYAGAASCIILANWGSAWGTWKAGLGVCNMGVNYPKGVIKNIVPIVMAGVLGIYGLIVSVIIAQAVNPPSYNNDQVVGSYSIYNGWAHLAAGLCCGLSCLASGGTIGILGDVGVRAFGLKASAGKRHWDFDEGEGGDSAGIEARALEGSNKLYVGLLIMLIFAEALALYGLIVALILSQNTYYCEA